MKLANKIQYHLISWCRGHGTEIILPNFYYGVFEMDVFRLTESQVVVQYEIKISRSDFRNDFKKKTQVWANKDEHTALSPKDRRNFKTVFLDVNKHEAIAAGNGNCNRFFFVVPKGLVKPEEVPDHAGLIYFEEYEMYCSFTIVKNAKLIKGHKVSPDIYKQLARSLSYRESLHRERARIAKFDLQKAKEEIKQLTS